MVVLVFNLSGYYWPWTEERRGWAENARSDAALVRFLEANGVTWVCGDYWAVYPVNFLSRLRVLGIPYQRQFDFYRYGEMLPPASRRFALLSRDREELVDWVARAGLTGSILSPAPGYVAFLPNPVAGDSPSRALAKVRASRS
jgi:hypothetical protein